MAREYARYLMSTHKSGDWASLSTTEHDCYMALLSSPELEWSGVAPYFPARYASLASDLNTRKVAKAWQALETAGMLVIDRETGELLVRSFLRHDRVFSKPNIVKAFCRAYERVASAKLRGVIRAEIARIHAEEGASHASSWEIIAERLPELFEELFPEPFEE